MDNTALDRQNRRLQRLKAEGVQRSTVFVHDDCKSALDAMRPFLINPLQAPLFAQLLADVQARAQPVNVAQVAQLSPFRYPGGKTWLVPELRRWLTTLKPASSFVEPFAGGASCSLMVASEQRAELVWIGEIDADVAAVWRTIFNSKPIDVKWLCNEILEFDVNEKAVRAILASEPKKLRDVAWRTIVRNRMQRGGILAPGAGLVKGGENGNGLLSRWYPETLVTRIEKLQALRGRINVRQADAFELIAEHANDKTAVFLIDPPYTAGGKNAGSRLYTHHAIDHELLFSTMAKVKGSVMMTYDDAPEVRALAERFGFSQHRVPMKSTHHEVHKELILTR